MNKAPMQRHPLLRPSPIVRPLIQARWALLPAALLPLAAMGNPTGGSVVAGQANITGGAGLTTIQQQSASAVINWQQFGIGNGETVNFVQPSASAAILNRIIGGSASEIFGNLTSNGRVFLINPQGVMFGAGARIDVGSLVASTLDIRNEDFMAGRYVLASSANPAGVLNNGVITARDGGFVVLAGGDVQNGGLIQTRLGDVVLASGAGLTLDMNDTGLISYRIDAAALSDVAGVVNTGSLMADGGRVFMGANVARELAATAVNNSGQVRAVSIGEHNGEIVLQALGGNTRNTGTLTATNESGVGGSIQVLGDRDVEIRGGTVDASGTAGGGVIRVGGGWQGGEGLVEAARTYVAPDALLRADATGQGQGGNIAVWSSEQTILPGRISARGAGSGHGGDVETSSHGHLDIRNAPDIAGGLSGGLGGSWLIDPYNISITSSSTQGVGVSGTSDNQIYSANASGSVIEVGLVLQGLANGGRVTINTGTGGNEDGDISLDAPLDFANINGTGVLTLLAADDLRINNQILNGGYGGSTSRLVLDLRAGVRPDGSTRSGTNGSIVISSAISTNGGALSILSAGGSVAINNALNSNGGDITVRSTSTTGNGNISTSTSASGLGIFSRGGNIRLQSGTNGGISFTANSSAFTLDASNGVQIGDINLIAGSGGVTSGGNAGASPAFVGRNSTIESTGSVVLTGVQFSARETARINVTAGNVDFNSITAGRAADLQASGSVRVRDLRLGNINATTQIANLRAVALGGNLIVDNAFSFESNNRYGVVELSGTGPSFLAQFEAGGNTAADTLLATSLSATNTGGGLTLHALSSANPARVTFANGNLTGSTGVASLSTQGTIRLNASGNITTNNLLADRSNAQYRLASGGENVDASMVINSTAGSVSTGSIQTQASTANGSNLNLHNTDATVRISANGSIKTGSINAFASNRSGTTQFVTEMSSAYVALNATNGNIVTQSVSATADYEGPRSFQGGADIRMTAAQGISTNGLSIGSNIAAGGASVNVGYTDGTSALVPLGVTLSSVGDVRVNGSIGSNIALTQPNAGLLSQPHGAIKIKTDALSAANIGNIVVDGSITASGSERRNATDTPLASQPGVGMSSSGGGITFGNTQTSTPNITATAGNITLTANSGIAVLGNLAVPTQGTWQAGNVSVRSENGSITAGLINVNAGESIRAYGNSIALGSQSVLNAGTVEYHAFANDLTLGAMSVGLGNAGTYRLFNLEAADEITISGLGSTRTIKAEGIRIVSGDDFVNPLLTLQSTNGGVSVTAGQIELASVEAQAGPVGSYTLGSLRNNQRLFAANGVQLSAAADLVVGDVRITGQTFQNGQQGFTFIDLQATTACLVSCNQVPGDVLTTGNLRVAGSGGGNISVRNSGTGVTRLGNISAPIFINGDFFSRLNSVSIVAAGALQLDQSGNAGFADQLVAGNLLLQAGGDLDESDTSLVATTGNIQVQGLGQGVVRLGNLTTQRNLTGNTGTEADRSVLVQANSTVALGDISTTSVRIGGGDTANASVVVNTSGAIRTGRVVTAATAELSHANALVSLTGSAPLRGTAPPPAIQTGTIETSAVGLFDANAGVVINAGGGLALIGGDIKTSALADSAALDTRAYANGSVQLYQNNAGFQTQNITTVARAGTELSPGNAPAHADASVQLRVSSSAIASSNNSLGAIKTDARAFGRDAVADTGYGGSFAATAFASPSQGNGEASSNSFADGEVRLLTETNDCTLFDCYGGGLPTGFGNSVSTGRIVTNAISVSDAGTDTSNGGVTAAIFGGDLQINGGAAVDGDVLLRTLAINQPGNANARTNGSLRLLPGADGSVNLVVASRRDVTLRSAGDIQLESLAADSITVDAANRVLGADMARDRGIKLTAAAGDINLIAPSGVFAPNITLEAEGFILSNTVLDTLERDSAGVPLTNAGTVTLRTGAGAAQLLRRAPSSPFDAQIAFAAYESSTTSSVIADNLLLTATGILGDGQGNGNKDSTVVDGNLSLSTTVASLTASSLSAGRNLTLSSAADIVVESASGNVVQIDSGAGGITRIGSIAAGDGLNVDDTLDHLLTEIGSIRSRGTVNIGTLSPLHSVGIGSINAAPGFTASTVVVQGGNGLSIETLDRVSGAATLTAGSGETLTIDRATAGSLNLTGSTISAETANAAVVLRSTTGDLEVLTSGLSGNGLTLDSARALRLTGDPTLNAGTGTLLLAATQGSITLPQTLTANSVSITAPSVALTATTPLNLGGTFTLDATGSDASLSRQVTAAAINITAARDLLLQGAASLTRDLTSTGSAGMTITAQRVFGEHVRIDSTGFGDIRLGTTDVVSNSDLFIASQRELTLGDATGAGDTSILSGARAALTAGDVRSNTGFVRVESRNDPVQGIPVGEVRTGNLSLGSVNTATVSGPGNIVVGGFGSIAAGSTVSLTALGGSATVSSVAPATAPNGTLNITGRDGIVFAAPAPLGVNTFENTLLNLTVQGASNLTLGDLNVRSLTATAGTGAITFGNITASQSGISLTGGTLAASALTASNGTISLNSTSGNSAAIGAVNGGTVIINTVAGATGRNGAALSITAGAGGINAGANLLGNGGNGLLTGRSVSLISAGAVALGDARITGFSDAGGVGTVTINSQGRVQAGAVTAQGSVTVYSGGTSTITLGNVSVGGTGGAITIGERALLDGTADSSTINVGTLGAQGRVQVRSEGGNVTVAGIAATTPSTSEVDLYSSGTLKLGSLSTAPGSLSLTGLGALDLGTSLSTLPLTTTTLSLTTASASPLDVGNLDVAGLTVRTGSGGARFGSITSASTISLLGNAGAYSATGPLVANGLITLRGSRFTGGDVISRNGGVDSLTLDGNSVFGTVQGAQAVSIISGSSPTSITVGSVRGSTVTVQANGSLGNGAAPLTITSDVGDLTVTASSITASTLTLDAGAALVRNAAVNVSGLTTLLAESGTLSLDGIKTNSLKATGPNLAATQNINLAGTLDLDASGRIVALALGGNSSVLINAGSLNATGISSTSGSIVGTVDGAATVSSLNAGSGIDLRTGGDVTLDGSGTAGGAFNMTSGGGIFDVSSEGIALTGASINLSAAGRITSPDLTLRSTLGDVVVSATSLDAPRIELVSGANLITGSTLLNAGDGGSTTLTARTGAVSLGGVTSRDLSVTSESINQTAALSVLGNLDLSTTSGDLVTAALTAGGTLDLNSNGLIRTGALQGSSVLVRSLNGGIDTQDITATNGFIDVQSAVTEGEALDVTLGDLEAIKGEVVVYSGGRNATTRIDSIKAGLDVIVDNNAEDDFYALTDIGTVVSDGSVFIGSSLASHAVRLGSVTAGGNVILAAGNGLAAGDLTSGGTLQYNVSRIEAGTLSAASVLGVSDTTTSLFAASGGTIDLEGGGTITVDTLSGGSASLVSSAGDVLVSTGNLSGLASLTANTGEGRVAVDALSAGSIEITGALLSNRTVDDGYGGGQMPISGDLTLQSMQGSILLAALMGVDGNIVVDSADGLTAVGGSAGRDVTLTAVNELIASGEYRSPGAVELRSSDATVLLSEASVIAEGPVRLEGRTVQLDGSLLQGGDLDLVGTEQVRLDNSRIEGNLSYFSADTIAATEAVTIDVAALTAAGRQLDFSGANIVIGQGEAPLAQSYGLVDELRRQGFPLPASLTPNASFDASESLVLSSLSGNAHYVALRAPVASLPDFGSISSTAGDLFLHYVPTDDEADFTFDLARLDFASSAATFAFGSSSYMGAIYITDPATGITAGPDKALTPAGNNTNYITLSEGVTFGSPELQRATTGRVVVLGPVPPPAPVPTPPQQPQPPQPSPPVPAPEPAPAPVIEIAPQLAVLLKDQLAPVTKSDDDTTDAGQPLVAETSLVSQDSGAQPNQQCDAI